MTLITGSCLQADNWCRMFLDDEGLELCGKWFQARPEKPIDSTLSSSTRYSYTLCFAGILMKVKITDHETGEMFDYTVVD